MNIRDHKLEGDGVAYKETPNRGGMLEPQYLVFHYTAGSSAQGSIESLCTKKPTGNASAHLVLARDGSITQLAPFNVSTWHAGISHWNGLTGMNQYTIGIEVDNAGKLIQVGEKYRAWFGREYPEDQVVRARHKNESETACWHAFTEEQIKAALDLSQLLIEKYNLKDILGHEDIAPGRKTDPGPAFPLSNIRSAVFGRSQDENEIYKVIAETLNIRKGPGIEYDTVSPPLLRGTRLVVLEVRERWSRVDVEGPNDIEGWVNNKFIERV